MAERGDGVAVVPSSASHFDAGLTCKIVGVLSDVGEFDDVGVHVWTYDDGRRPAVPDGGSFCGWEVGAAAASGRPGSLTKRQPSEAASAGGQGEVNYVANNIQNAKSYRQHGKAADVDYSSAVVCKTCVEPATYRYIPDNGKYRLSKALIQKLDARKPPKRPADARLLNPEQKRLQKEIQRELRREFELAEDRARAEDRERNGSLNAYSQPSPSYRAVREQLEEERRHSGPEPEPKPTDGASPQADRCSSPIVLPPIAVPLVKNGGQSAASEGISSQVEAFREVSNAGGGGRPNDHRRTRRGLHLGIRSRSEPPPGASVTSSGAGRSSLVGLEVTPTALRRDRTAPSSSGARSRGAAARERREGPEEAPRRQDDGWTGQEPAGGRREDAGERAPPDDGRRRPTSVDGVLASTSRAKRTTKARVDPDVGSATAARQASTCGVPLMQIKYMAASGEVCTLPNFDRSPEGVSTDRPSCPTAGEPPSAGVDVGRPDADDASFATSKHLGPTPAKARLKDAAAKSYKPHAARTNNHVFSELNSGKLLSGGYRAVPVGQVRLSDQQPAESRRKNVDILPKISGRKVTMAVTSHRIV